MEKLAKKATDEVKQRIDEEHQRLLIAETKARQEYEALRRDRDLILRACRLFSTIAGDTRVGGRTLQNFNSRRIMESMEIMCSALERSSNDCLEAEEKRTNHELERRRYDAYQQLVSLLCDQAVTRALSLQKIMASVMAQEAQQGHSNVYDIDCCGNTNISEQLEEDFRILLATIDRPMEFFQLGIQMNKAMIQGLTERGMMTSSQSEKVLQECLVQEENLGTLMSSAGSFFR